MVSIILSDSHRAVAAHSVILNAVRDDSKGTGMYVKDILIRELLKTMYGSILSRAVSSILSSSNSSSSSSSRAALNF